MKRIVFLATEDWFVRSHFLGLLHCAQAEGFDVVVAARASGALDAEAVRVIDTPFARGSLKPWALIRQVAHLRRVLDQERPDVVHAIGLKPVVLLILSGFRAAGRLFAITGRGYLAVARSPWARLMSEAVRLLLRRAVTEPRSALLVENATDRDWVGMGLSFTMPGAGVDPSAFTVSPQPKAPPIVVGIVSRLVASKGIDLAVGAVGCLRANGVSVLLRVAGGADPENPAQVSEAELSRWRDVEGVQLIGAIKDVSGFWAGAHIACLPSRGGEGLPRSLLEAAACGRAIVTTDVPGCADFVRHGETGLVCAPDDIGALAAAIETLAQDEGLRARMGETGRAMIEAHYTEAHAAACAAAAWRALLEQSA